MGCGMRLDFSALGQVSWASVSEQGAIGRLSGVSSADKGVNEIDNPGRLDVRVVTGFLYSQEPSLAF